MQIFKIDVAVNFETFHTFQDSSYARVPEMSFSLEYVSQENHLRTGNSGDLGIGHQLQETNLTLTHILPVGKFKILYQISLSAKLSTYNTEKIIRS